MEQPTNAACRALIRINQMRLLARRLVRYLPISIFIISIAMFLGALVAASIPQRFEATTTLVLTNAQGMTLGGDALVNIPAIMATPAFAREVVIRSGIKSSAELELSFLPAALARWLESFGFDHFAQNKQSEAKLVQAYLGALTIDASPDGRTLTITVAANEPNTARRAANITAKVYLEQLHASILKNAPAMSIQKKRVIQAQTTLQQALEKERTFRTNPAGQETARRARKVADELSLLLTDRASLIAQRDALAQGAVKHGHLSARIHDLETAIRLRQAIITAATDNDMRQQSLMRAVESARLELALEREKYNDERMQVQTGDLANYIIDPAKLPETLNRALPLTVGGLSALVIAAGLFWLMLSLKKTNYEYFVRNNKYNEHDQVVEAHLAPDLNVSLNQPDNTPTLSLVEEKQFPFPVVRLSVDGGKAYDKLRDLLAAVPQQGGGVHLLVAGADGEVDTLLFAREFARHLAMRGRTVLLDLLQPKPGDEAQTSGLTDFIAGHSSFAEIISRDPGSRLHIVSHGKYELKHGQMGDAIELAVVALDQTYDWIVHAIPLDLQNGLVNYSFKHADGAVLVDQAQAVGEKTTEFYEMLRAKGVENTVVLLAD